MIKEFYVHGPADRLAWNAVEAAGRASIRAACDRQRFQILGDMIAKKDHIAQ